MRAGRRVGRRGASGFLAALGALAGCSSSDTPAAPETAQGDEIIACAVSGSGQLKKVCSVERHRKNGALTLVVHHPDGGFRRFEVQSDGTGLAPSDGADAAVLHLEDGRLEVSVGPDRYVFPVTVKTPTTP